MQVVNIHRFMDLEAFLLDRVQAGRGLSPDEVYDLYQAVEQCDPPEDSSGGDTSGHEALLEDLRNAGTLQEIHRAVLDFISNGHDAMMDTVWDLLEESAYPPKQAEQEKI